MNLGFGFSEPSTGLLDGRYKAPIPEFQWFPRFPHPCPCFTSQSVFFFFLLFIIIIIIIIIFFSC